MMHVNEVIDIAIFLSFNFVYAARFVFFVDITT